MSKKRKEKGVLGFDEVMDVARYLGWHTHDENGERNSLAVAVCKELAGKVKENVVLPTLIAAEFDKQRKLAMVQAGDE